MTNRSRNQSADSPDPALHDRVIDPFAERADSTTPEPALMDTSEKPRPNIKFAARPTFDAGRRKVLKDPAPIDRFSEGGRLIFLPPADWQKTNRLFYHCDADLIARAFPHLYKLVTSKGRAD